jgi:hypothetical protein
MKPGGREIQVTLDNEAAGECRYRDHAAVAFGRESILEQLMRSVVSCV